MAFVLATPREGASERCAEERAARRSFARVVALLFATSATLTVAWCTSMATMGEMPMPGGWAMSMSWMPMPGQTWPGVAVSFVGMWLLMMVAMMLPSVAPMLWRYRMEATRTREVRPGRLAFLVTTVSAGYFAVWAALGLALFTAGAALMALTMREPSVSRAVPGLAGAVVLIAGAFQFSSAKERRLAGCRETKEGRRGVPPAALTAFRHGLCVGLDCAQCCAGPTAVLLVFGVMDLRAMAVVTVAVTAERLAPAGMNVARATGGLAMAAGLAMIARAAGVG